MTTSIQVLLQTAEAFLQPVTPSPTLEAEILLSFALGQPRSFLHAWPLQNVSFEETNCFKAYLQRRINHEPIAYITGIKEFWSLALIVNPHTLIPRPETELMVEMILEKYPAKPVLRVAELGTGSGAIALALASERPLWQIVATDQCADALKVARENAIRLKLPTVQFHQGNWCDALPSCEFDLMISNPPYIAETEWEEYAAGLQFEPKAALISGEDGLAAIREIVNSAKRYLKMKGSLILEHGHLQAKAVRELFTQAGYDGIHSFLDLSGRERITLGQHLGRMA